MKMLGGSLLTVAFLVVVAYVAFPSAREHAGGVLRDVERRGVIVPQQAGPWAFYGQVIDEGGKPVEGAQVTVEVYRRTPNPIINGSVVKSDLGLRRLTLRTDRAGKFSVQVPPPLEELEVISVDKPGYDWVIDWWWTTGEKRTGDNRAFNFLRGTYTHGIYHPDPALPALFPLHPKGSTSPATRPSRGGSDTGELGRAVNEPTDWVIPSHGTGAPKGNDEVGQLIRRHGDRLNAEAAERERQRVAAATTRRSPAAIERDRRAALRRSRREAGESGGSGQMKGSGP